MFDWVDSCFREYDQSCQPKKEDKFAKYDKLMLDFARRLTKVPGYSLYQYQREIFYFVS